MTLRRQLLGGRFPPKRALLMGSSHGEIEPKKATYRAAGRNKKNPDRIGAKLLKGETFPPPLIPTAARVKGTQWLKWLHLKEHNNLTKGTKKNTYEVVLGKVEPQVGWTSSGKPRCG